MRKTEEKKKKKRKQKKRGEKKKNHLDIVICSIRLCLIHIGEKKTLHSPFMRHRDKHTNSHTIQNNEGKIISDIHPWQFALVTARQSTAGTLRHSDGVHIHSTARKTFQSGGRNSHYRATSQRHKKNPQRKHCPVQPPKSMSQA